MKISLDIPCCVFWQHKQERKMMQYSQILDFIELYEGSVSIRIGSMLAQKFGISRHETLRHLISESKLF